MLGQSQDQNLNDRNNRQKPEIAPQKEEQMPPYAPKLVEKLRKQYVIACREKRMKELQKAERMRDMRLAREAKQY